MIAGFFSFSFFETQFCGACFILGFYYCFCLNVAEKNIRRIEIT